MEMNRTAMSERLPGTRRPPDLWEAGCRTDPIRNSFVVPYLRSAVGRLKPRDLVDIGCGTGYISRAVAERLQHRPLRWHLVDNSPEMLHFAQQRRVAHVETVVHNLNLEEPRWEDPPPASDLGFMAYTLLDLKLSRVLVGNIASLVRPQGTLFVFMPDVLEDVIQAAAVRRETIHDFRRGHCSIEKVDKFTARPVSFEANRFEYVVAEFLRGGFVLEGLENYVSHGDHNHYCLSFRAAHNHLPRRHV